MGQKSIKVLVVEDEFLVRMAIVDHLEDAGFEVLEAGDADEAISILTSDLSVRLVFTDVDMPGSMDGLKLAAAVRDRWPPIKIVVTSGHRNVRAEDLPAEVRFFQKPYNPDRIVQAFQDMTAT